MNLIVHLLYCGSNRANDVAVYREVIQLLTKSCILLCGGEYFRDALLTLGILKLLIKVSKKEIRKVEKDQVEEESARDPKGIYLGKYVD